MSTKQVWRKRIDLENLDGVNFRSRRWDVDARIEITGDIAGRIAHEDIEVEDFPYAELIVRYAINGSEMKEEIIAKVDIHDMVYLTAIEKDFTFTLKDWLSTKIAEIFSIEDVMTILGFIKAVEWPCPQLTTQGESGSKNISNGDPLAGLAD